MDSVTRQPIARVLVESPAGGPGVLTDNAGRFSFSGIPVGATQLRFRRPGYFDPQTGQSEASAPVTVTENTPEQTVVLEPAASLLGQVTLSDGDSPVGMRVTLLREHVVDGWRRWQRRESAAVRADGSFAFDNLQPSSYLLHAEASLDPMPDDRAARVRSGYAPAYAPGAAEAAGASVFPLRAGQTGEARLRLQRVPFYPVKVRLAQEAQGQFLVNGGGFVDWPARPSREDGTVTAELPAGNYLLTGRSFGREPEIGELPLHVVGASLSGQSLALSGAGALALQTSGDGAGSQGVLLTFTPVAAEGQSQSMFVTPGESAHAARSMPQPGQYWVSATVGGGYVAELSSGGVDLFSQPLRIGPGENPTISAVLRQDGGSVTVTRAGDALAAACFVQVLPLGRAGIARHASAAASGEPTITLSNFPPGDYLVLATPFREEFPYREPGVMQQLKGVRVTVTAGGSAQTSISNLFAGEAL